MFHLVSINNGVATNHFRETFNKVCPSRETCILAAKVTTVAAVVIALGVGGVALFGAAGGIYAAAHAAALAGNLSLGGAIIAIHKVFFLYGASAGMGIASLSTLATAYKTNMFKVTDKNMKDFAKFLGYQSLITAGCTAAGGAAGVASYWVWTVGVISVTLVKFAINPASLHIISHL